MAQIQALDFGTLERADPTDDGRHALLSTVRSDGERMVVAVRQDHIMTLITALAAVNDRCRKASGVPAERIETIKASRWDLTVSQQDDQKLYVCSFRLDPIGALSFVVDAQTLVAMSEAIQSEVQGISPQNSGTYLM